MKKCNQCQLQFQISEADKKFYKRIDVPEPTLCPSCRSQRRLAWRNERNLYKRKCDLTGKSIISIYPADSPFKVYGPDVWYTDKWDAMNYGRDFDFNSKSSSGSFFEQFADLQKVAPRIGQVVINLENCPYGNQMWYCKNSYLCFDAGFNEDALFCDATYHSKNVADCSFVRNCEFSYFLTDCIKCCNSFFLQDCINCSDSFFSIDCGSCQNIAFCHNLRNKKNYLFNQPVSEEKFKQVISDIKSGSYIKWQEYRRQFKEKILALAVHKENHNINIENCTGDYLQNCKNCQNCFDCDSSEDLNYVTRADEKIFLSMDIDHCSIAQSCYEGICISGNNINFSFNSYHPNNSELYYCDSMANCQNCFGCISLSNKKYCILNKQYSKKEYDELIPKIIKYMQSTPPAAGQAVEWGEFFPVTLSPFAYNETVANEYFPLTKDEVINKGWKWRDQNQRDYQKQTYDLPDNLSDISDDIFKAILVCGDCRKNYKITSHELKFYRKFNLPIPRKCNDCRHNERLAFRNARMLFDRKCMKCKADVRTTYSPDRQEKVYCEKCYLETVY